MDNRNLAIGIFKAAIVMVVFWAMCVPATAPAPSAPIYSDWSAFAPSIDGDFTDGEWETAQLLIEDPIHTYVYFMNDNEHLYICVDAANGAGGDYTEDDGDYCNFLFDTPPRGVWSPGHEDGFCIYGSEAKYHSVATDTGRILHCNNFSVHPGLEGRVGFGTSPNAPFQNHRIYEFKIPLSLLTASPGDTLGFASEYDSIPYDANTGRHNDWPPGLIMSNFTTWGDLVLASPPQASTLTPTGLIALVSLLSAIAAVAIVRKRR
jgi:hypothetical protein